jgi:hypothetical protein
MKVAEFQKFILSMGEVMKASGAAGVGKELAELASALDRFKDTTLLGLRDILNKAGEEAGGGSSRGGAGKGKGQPDEAKIQSALGRIQQLQARALDPSLTKADVEAVVKPLEKEMTSDELNELAKRFGLHKKQGSKAKTTEAIIKRIVDQKGAYARGLE